MATLGRLFRVASIHFLRVRVALSLYVRAVCPAPYDVCTMPSLIDDTDVIVLIRPLGFNFVLKADVKINSTEVVFNEI